MHSLGTTLLAFDLLCFVFKAKFAFYFRYLLISYFCIPVPYDKKDIFFRGVFVLEGLIGLHRTVQLQLLQDYCLGIDLDYCDIEWFALEMNRDHSVVFEIAPSTSFQTLLFTMRATLFLLRHSCPQ